MTRFKLIYVIYKIPCHRARAWLAAECAHEQRYLVYKLYTTFPLSVYNVYQGLSCILVIYNLNLDIRCIPKAEKVGPFGG